MEVLSKDQKEFYEREGYLVLERRIPMDVIEAIRAEIARFEETARGMTASDEKIDLEDSHTPDDPRVRRVKRPDTQSETFAELMEIRERIVGRTRELQRSGGNLRQFVWHHTSSLEVHGAEVWLFGCVEMQTEAVTVRLGSRGSTVFFVSAGRI